MNFDTWVIYALAVLILSASPGPSILLCMTKSVTEGFRASLFSVFGALLALVMIMTLSFTGLGVIITSSEILFDVVKWAGAAYLVYLGYKAFTSNEHTYHLAKEDDKLTKSSGLKLFVSGFLVGASNPKAIVFFTALFPQFINQNEPLPLQYLIFVSTFTVTELSWLLLYAYFGSKSSAWLTKKGRARTFNKVTGSIFMGAGVLLSTTSKN
jgi:RhtB (resistance to homoserine/threonine) family protein